MSRAMMSRMPTIVQMSPERGTASPFHGEFELGSQVPKTAKMLNLEAGAGGRLSGGVESVHDGAHGLDRLRGPRPYVTSDLDEPEIRQSE